MFLKQRLSAAEKRARTKKMPLSIAFLDTGISPVADFILPQNRIIAFVDLVNGKTEPYDDNGHGTHVTVFMEGETILRKADLRKQKIPFRSASGQKGILLFAMVFCTQITYNRCTP